MIALAFQLRKTIAEVEDMTLDEYNEWIAYFTLLNEEQEKGKGHAKPSR